MQYSAVTQTGTTNVLSFSHTAGLANGAVKFPQVQLASGSFAGSQSAATLTANRTYTYPDQSGTVGLVLSGTTAAIGGAALANGACTTGTVSIASATPSMVASTSPATDPGAGIDWQAWVSSAGTVTVRICNFTSGSITPTSTTYNVRVAQ